MCLLLFQHCLNWDEKLEILIIAFYFQIARILLINEIPTSPFFSTFALFNRHGNQAQFPFLESICSLWFAWSNIFVFSRISQLQCKINRHKDMGNQDTKKRQNIVDLCIEKKSITLALLSLVWKHCQTWTFFYTKSCVKQIQMNTNKSNFLSKTTNYFHTIFTLVFKK